MLIQLTMLRYREQLDNPDIMLCVCYADAGQYRTPGECLLLLDFRGNVLGNAPIICDGATEEAFDVMRAFEGTFPTA